MSRRGFSLTELLVVIALTAVVAGTATIMLFRRQGVSELTGTTGIAVTYLRSAQQNAISDASSTAWGVRFDNTSSTAGQIHMFASSTFATSAITTSYRLPRSLRFEPTYLLVGTTKDVIFARRTGFPQGTSTVTFRTATGSNYYRVDVSSVGIVSSTRSTTLP